MADKKVWTTPFKVDPLDGARLYEARICYAVTVGVYAMGVTPDQAFDNLLSIAKAHGSSRTNRSSLLKDTRIVVLPPGITHHGFDGYNVRWLGLSGPKSVRLEWDTKLKAWCVED